MDEERKTITVQAPHDMIDMGRVAYTAWCEACLTLGFPPEMAQPWESISEQAQWAWQVVGSSVCIQAHVQRSYNLN